LLKEQNALLCSNDNVARYYNSWIENTDQVAEEDAASTVSAEPSSHLAAASDHVAPASRPSLPTADTDLSHSVDDVDKDNEDDDDDDDDDTDVFRSFM